MKKPARDGARIGDAARLLPILGAFLLMPPIISLFAGGGQVGGVPAVIVYLFVTWLALIACAALLARWLRPLHDATPGGTDPHVNERGRERQEHVNEGGQQREDTR